MHNLVRAGAAALVLSLFLGLQALAQGAPQGSPKPDAADPVAARVNGVEIRRSEVLEAMENLPAQYRQLPVEVLYPNILGQIVDRKLVSQVAEKARLGDDVEVKRRLAGLRERVLQEFYLRREIEKGLTDDKLRTHYDRLVREKPPQEEVHARHILVASEADARTAIADLDKGADFVDVAKKRSTGPSAANGGDLGYFTRDQMVPEFAEMAFKLKKGEISKAPVKTQFGWHVIKVEDRRQGAAPSFDETRDDLRRELAEEMLASLLDDLRKKAKVEQFNLDGTALVPQPAAPAAPSQGRKP